MTAPTLMPTQVPEGHTSGVTYRIEGELVPVLHLALDGTVPVYFEHHIVLWKEPRVEIGMHPLKGAFKRAISGMPIFMTDARGPGEIAFSRDGAGHVLALHIPHGESIYTREHQFLAATGNLAYDFEQVKGFANMLFGGSGFFIDRFTSTNGEGVLWLHGFGNVFEVTLAAGEQIDVEPGGWIYRDGSVGYTQQVMSLKSGLLAGAGRLVFNRFTGPGRVGLQSMYWHPPAAETGR